MLTGYLLTVQTASAGPGSRIRGGDVIDTSSNASELRELSAHLDSSRACEMISGRSLQQRLSYYPTLMNKLRRIDWFLASVIDGEFARLKICLTGKLKTLPTTDPGSPIDDAGNPREGTDTVGLRLNNFVFINWDLLRQKVAVRSQTFFLMHEIAHAFYPYEENEDSNSTRFRYNGVRTFVRLLSRVDQMQIGTAAQLATARQFLREQLDLMAFPVRYRLDALDPHQTEISALLLNGSEAARSYLKQPRLVRSVIRLSSASFIGSLSPLTASWFSQDQIREKLLRDFSAACDQLTDSEWDRFVRIDAPPATHPYVACLSAFSQIATYRASQLLTEPVYQSWLNQYWFTMVEKNIVVPPSSSAYLQAVGESWSDFGYPTMMSTGIGMSAIGMAPYTQLREWLESTTEPTRFFVEFLTQLAVNGSLQDLTRILGNARFREVFGLEDVKRSLLLLPDSRRSEAQYLAGRVFPDLTSGILRNLKQAVNDRLSSAQRQGFEAAWANAALKTE